MCEIIVKFNLRYLFSLLLLITSIVNVKGEEATISFGTNQVKINAKSVNAKDSQDNTWTITTEGTTSYTQATSYSQVGSSNSPATSITFTTTLPNKINVKSFSAKFGGFSGTAGTIKLKVDDTEVGSGSLNATNDVVVDNTKEVEGSTLTVTVTGIAKGVKCYQIYYSDGNVDTRAEVNMSSFATEGNVTSIAKGSTLNTSVITDQSDWTPSYIFTSSNESVAKVSFDGVITALSVGSAKITATLNIDNNDSQYKLGTTISKSINITVTPAKHKVYFYANGTLLNDGETEFEEGKEVTFPTAPEDVNNMKFMGWYGTEYFNATKAPEFIKSATMDEQDLNLYAVYASVLSEGDGKTVVFNANGLSTASYKSGTNKDDSNNEWTYYAAVNNQSGTLSFGLNSNANNYNIGSPVFDKDITAITIKAYNGSSTAKRKIFICSSNKTAQPSKGDIAELTVNASEKFTTVFTADLSKAEPFNQFYIYVSAALSVSEVKVTYGTPATYANYCTTLPSSVNLVAQLGDNYWATFSNSSAVEFIGETTSVYTVSVNDDELVLNEVSSKQIPANTGVLIKSSSSTAYYVDIDSAEPLSNNLLKPASESMVGNDVYYKLAYDNYTDKTGLGFYYGANDGGAFSCKAGTAYLAVPSNISNEVKSFVLNESEITLIKDVYVPKFDASAPVYNMSGQRVSVNTKGIVFQNGKKYFIK